MTYEVFEAKVNALIERAGGKIKVRFSRDEEKGQFYADCSDGTRITANPVSLKATVLFGSGHQAMTTL